ncbi:hypothetical protein P175DRAFT_0535640 [Aspergillus ochraceoroseus IBT 24754]|uniref:Cystathionine gamma-synthase n=2 Tax=Aspergillus ochraceoroseus TaxID=138278 RepID=A0A2T5LNP6_9EURO|nr:uncharacterized protein P175DRAFT_0535640 [Aspergillus ochraceoroseus IBT 24754]KKK14354.1 hypothetical protein AOCH_006081 [Aspergillus ochraceoroseus]PTU17897.1 hypothetical protein P175DRAFT_0535640 [Aspergillus ochraceoroseus IBT 24754]
MGGHILHLPSPLLSVDYDEARLVEKSACHVLGIDTAPVEDILSDLRSREWPRGPWISSARTKVPKLTSEFFSVGDSKTIVIHPSHRTDAERLGIGATDDLIRLSAGTEHIDDLIKDLDQGLEKAAAVHP